MLLDEERRFRDLLEPGPQGPVPAAGSGPLTEEDYRYLHETHGLPREFVPAMLPGPHQAPARGLAAVPAAPDFAPRV